MTEEQINSLKEGDKFAVEYTVSKHENGKVCIKLANGDVFGVWLHSDNILTQGTLVTPSPTFEVGDTVKIVPDPLTHTIYNKENEFDLCIHGKTVKIAKTVDGKGDVVVDTGAGTDSLSIHCLKLVKKAVKDKYIVEEDDLAWCVTDKNWSVCSFNKSNHPDAKAAAEAECARLNAEWRKKEKGGAE